MSILASIRHVGDEFLDVLPQHLVGLLQLTGLLVQLLIRVPQARDFAAQRRLVLRCCLVGHLHRCEVLVILLPLLRQLLHVRLLLLGQSLLQLTQACGDLLDGVGATAEQLLQRRQLGHGLGVLRRKCLQIGLLVYLQQVLSPRNVVSLLCLRHGSNGSPYVMRIHRKGLGWGRLPVRHLCMARPGLLRSWRRPRWSLRRLLLGAGCLWCGWRLGRG
mmetsp:Transcript_3740/g.8764  ORF Transcript_3740/g.8764 Transcript_3740/m.8764 type:complete len:217 (-) Transcript_3740:995-1645(-)